MILYVLRGSRQRSVETKRRLRQQCPELLWDNVQILPYNTSLTGVLFDAIYYERPVMAGEGRWLAGELRSNLKRHGTFRELRRDM